MEPKQNTPKERVDTLLVQKGYFDSREKAKRAIMAGLVFSQSEKIDKPGIKIPVDTLLTVKGSPVPYVSRGGLKLEKAIQSFQLNLQDKIVLDIGASTGGFTDCALKHGAKLVYAVDVGYGQLDWSLRNNDRVIVMERTNFRYSKPEDFPYGQPDLATIDVSFISLGLILPVLYDILKPHGMAVVLIKPQFEAGKEKVGKKGLVKDPLVHEEVLNKVLHQALDLGFLIKGLDYSPITGGEGNIEFLAALIRTEGEKVEKTDQEMAVWRPVISQVVKQAHHAL
ncbi:23S rRNA (cytidine1920-2'-O)/16S rRNA (cytidine1409-2'-O)-methyltransferase [Caldalkalibacillus uzonensis]|uniref:23S rRNA (Cytidine1920-2'-O)/16S rRNA (Cytidine1409-2'-O)-methyltransferase n=1 Tax=Caldalkalibacillus uzonensis TaxID=353224 RepID=A0ABU0CMS5_9BACI|nr:TlyA family RNA methyltransferase [Caldalkalibacillus uzonensis]MDQ0337719.1 23S rRNA (cytidine1920-2'-O)/16S rRNA (cytidine1409-2'-O)-methyltransferase [Caldalkalibacillus uzonensis]